ncbi:MAG TPA: hypothetical protein VE988_04880, partial [Gemmataceae bacterium]|nr:hypothetical protein [Gemmataceae bacterium]
FAVAEIKVTPWPSEIDMPAPGCFDSRQIGGQLAVTIGPTVVNFKTIKIAAHQPARDLAK